MATLTAISGVGAKGPACFLVECSGRRILIDLGYGPDPGAVPDLTGVGTIDALLISHGHRDHLGSLNLLRQVGNPPVFSTQIVADRNPGKITYILPLSGDANVLGIPVSTGRSGHAPGGIWLHLQCGEGLLYMGDYSVESLVYAYDRPPPANTIVIDASYGANDTSIGDAQKGLIAAAHSGPLLLPVPADGRGPEMALFLRNEGFSTLGLDESLRISIDRLISAESACLKPGLTRQLTDLLRDSGNATLDCPLVLATPADGTRGATAELLGAVEHKTEPQVMFSGYMPPGTPAQELVAQGRAMILTWNVHPRLRDNIELVKAVGARTVVPAFCDQGLLANLGNFFRPAKVVVTTPLTC